MKTKEEIEQLAEKYSALGQNAGLTHREYTLENIAYRRGYEQCQEDMAKRITDLENILHTICTWCNPHDSSHENIWRIANNSLNKQDEKLQ